MNAEQALDNFRRRFAGRPEVVSVGLRHSADEEYLLVTLRSALQLPSSFQGLRVDKKQT